MKPFVCQPTMKVYSNTMSNTVLTTLIGASHPG
jgi:hypothetical protein